MTRIQLPFRTLPFAALALGAALAIAACGGDSGGKPTATAAGASTGAGSANTGSSSTGARLDDATYVKAICTDVNDAINPILNKVAADPSLLSDQQKLITEATPALSDLSDKLSALSPPSDLQPYHDQITSRFKDVVTQAKAGQLKGIGDIGSVTRGVSVPQDVKDRIRTTGNQIPECQQSLALGSNFFG